MSKQQITVNTIQKYIRSQQIAFFAELPGIDAEIIEFIAKEGMKIIKKPLKDIEFPEYAIVGAVLKQDKNLEIPTGDTRIAPGDKVVVFTLPKALKAVEKLF
ncbi:MAG: TrkA C-terminal domain-containing protein [Bacteroidota bacterium]